MKQDYSIGIDIGTNSVGWAVVNIENNKLIRKGNKNLWGVLLFDDANTAEKTRGYRQNRRRYDRRRERIKYLKEIFNDEISKIDRNFFTNLKESNLWNEDKTIKSTYDKQKIKDYSYKYPTIYHLREKLVNSNEEKDIRLIYLAIHHMIKYRGNFLYNISKINKENLEIRNLLEDIFSSISEHCDNIIFNLDDINIEKLENILNSEERKKDKQTYIKNELSNILPNQISSNLSRLMIGFKADLGKIFGFDKSISISFNDSNYDEIINRNSEILDDNIETLETIKTLYDTVFLRELFNGKDFTNISKLMIDKYNKHHDDLKKLKNILKNNITIYNEIY